VPAEAIRRGSEVSPAIAGRSILERTGRAVLDWLLSSEAGADPVAALQRAAAHGVAGLAWAGLEAQPERSVPEALWEGLRAQARAQAARNLLLVARLSEIIRAADERGLPLVCFKGPALAVQIYGDAAARASTDLDLIVPHRDLPALAAVLSGLGYGPHRPQRLERRRWLPGEYVFTRVGADFHLEVHTEGTLRHFPRRLPLAELLGRCERVSAGGVPLPVFSPEDTLVLLAVHGAKDFWARLLWACDVAALVSANTLVWEVALERARRWGCLRMTRLALAMAAHSLPTACPAWVEHRLGDDASVQRLIEQLARGAARGRWQQLLYRWRLADGSLQGLVYIGRLLRQQLADRWLG
jgi:hypothetical protein